MFKKIKKAYKKWVKFGKKVANFQVKALFTIVYIIFIIPAGLLFKLFFDWKKGFHPSGENSSCLDSARRQF